MSVHAPLLFINRRRTPAAGGLDLAAVGDLIASELRSATAPCVSSSLQASGVVLVHMLREVMPDIPVLFLDTFHHFPETLRYRDQLVER